jgi:glycerol-3-phosphate dehydrogenase (NAD(P)+)
MKSNRIAIIGAGGWGTALAKLWGECKIDIVLWGRDAALIEQLRSTRENARYLPGIKLPEQIRLTNDVDDIRGAALIVFVTPSTAIRAIAEQMRLSILPDATLLSCSKGIEHGTGLRMSEILRDVLPHRAVAVLSGPNLAAEIARQQPAAAVLGCDDANIAAELQSRLGSPRFRIYTSGDVVSIELGGALKNVFAIAAGVCDGLQLGDNAKAALITRALAELIRLGSAMGGKPHTFYGLSGVGDLIVTCFSSRSRNRTVGERLGRGETLQRIVADMHTVAEGIPTSQSAFECARKIDIDTPIIDQVYEIVHRGKSPAQALNDLLQREQKPEMTNLP